MNAFNDTKDENLNIANDPWKIFIVDDDRSIHDVTKLVLRDLVFENKKLAFLQAYTIEEAKKIMQDNPDIAVIMLDVVMEEDDSGLKFVKFIREELNNHLVRIVLRTGQPGLAPENKIITHYDINDYKEKTELTSNKLNTLIITLLRSYNELKKSEQEQINIREQAARTIHEKDEYIKLITDALPVLISFIDENEIIQFYNKTYETWFHGIDASISKMKIETLFGKDAYSLFKSYWNKAFLGQSINFDMELHHYQQGLRNTNVTLVPYTFNSEFKGCFSLISDITERKQIEENLNYLANHDPLTGLLNRTHFDFQLEQILKYAEQKAEIFAILFLDIDEFKKINDTLGHEFGDIMLSLVSARLKECLRKSDIIARFGGDEFAILLGNITSREEIIAITDKIIKIMAEPFVLNEKEYIVSVSIGISIYPKDGMAKDTLLKNADLAMYCVKKSGKNAYQFYVSDLYASATNHLNLERDLRLSFIKNEFDIYYQPVIDLQTGAVNFIEALIRWHHPTRGLLLPKSFIPFVEEFGNIVAINEWVLTNACQQVYRLQQQGLPGLKVSVNISPTQFIKENFVQSVTDILKNIGLNPSDLYLELTENVLISNFESIHKNIEGLKKLGISVLLDDFGSGFSSLNYLSQLNVAGIKIDGSFTKLVVTDLRSAAIVSSITNLMRNLGIKTIVEEIENKVVTQFEFFL